MKRATIEKLKRACGYRISIHALCEEGDETVKVKPQRYLEISIHALCEEGDKRNLISLCHNCHISIHALCEEGDL